MGEEFVEITGDGRRTTSKVLRRDLFCFIGIFLLHRLFVLHQEDDHNRQWPHNHQVTIDGNTMIHVQKGDSARGEKDTKIVR